MPLIKKGAEANLFLEKFPERMYPADVDKVLVKERISKKYRDKELDRKLRDSRTSLEAKLISEAKKAGVPTPIIYQVDRDKMCLVMEYVEGKVVKEILEGLDSPSRKDLCKTIGKQIARLHDFGIVHGDLTTSNMIKTLGGSIYFIDFGLGEYNSSTEARGIDIHLLHRTLKSSHFQVANEAFQAVVNGYKEEFRKKADEVIRRVKEVESRGRYIAKEERK
ncbi:hypothetical protein AKJ57_05535 [candidate division MSBL1 archaeon SCGC-AAA259A05]|uniref:non-specific serine/threonine protein kinase n=1 Tax=candidate division MSBL1 archaeon SCGC-AAA259A05 TaxID=1698259 RepID=A0A133U524_9EURY|nr:hypothetical protein AKJ57_05535 [candidate division MSBL1 archaeon SCGC-AAA259A05]